MSKTKTKKLLLQNAYLQLEKKEVKEKCNLADIEIKKYLQEHFPEEYQSIYGKNITENDNNPEQEVIEENNKTSTKNKDMKKLYRKIAEKTHPDKIDDKEMLEVFRTAASAYNNGDIATILEIAGNLNIELLELSKESIELLENNVKKITKEIDTMKKTVGWSWTQVTSDEEKTFLITQIINFHKGQK